MELNINVSRITVAIDATPALIAAIAALTGANVPVQAKETKEVQEPRQAVASPAEAMAGMASAMGQASQAAAPAPQSEPQKKDEISDADMRKVIGPAVQKHGQQAIIGILNGFGITTNRVTDVPQEKRAEFLEQVKSLG